MAEPTLAPRLGVVSATALVVSNMIGTGIFAITGMQAGELVSPWLVLCGWVAGAILALVGALCYSELGVVDSDMRKVHQDQAKSREFRRPGNVTNL